MRLLIKKWGNSAAVRIPASVMAAASLSVDQAVDLREENGRIVIEPVCGPTYPLDELVAEMRPETFPDDESFGQAIGRETW